MSRVDGHCGLSIRRLHDPAHEVLTPADVGMGMVVVLGRTEEGRIQVRVRRQGASGGVGEELGDRRRDRLVLAAVQGEEGQVAEVVASRHARVGQVVPDRGQGADVEGVPDAIGGRRVRVEAVGVGRREDAGEPAVTDGEVIDQLARERQVAAGVVAEGEVVVAPPPEPVARPAVELDAATVVGVTGVVGPAPGVGGEVVGGVGEAGIVEVLEPALAALGALDPPEVVVEGAVLHAQDDDVVQAGVTGLWEAAPLRFAAGQDPPRGQASGRDPGKELTTGGHVQRQPPDDEADGVGTPVPRADTSGSLALSTQLDGRFDKALAARERVAPEGKGHGRGLPTSELAILGEGFRTPRAGYAVTRRELPGAEEPVDEPPADPLANVARHVEQDPIWVVTRARHRSGDLYQASLVHRAALGRS